ncbi:calcium-binding protein [Microvirga flavescens]|uniref:calcium-binding protein n=1 Tax=Microvirga flavescens TaxID=2249811 RepID=UPI000DD957F3|nr:calcium-binding protein [Microvirga flavescens]
MATYADNLFTLEINDTDFAIPATLPGGGATPADTNVLGNAKHNKIVGDQTANRLTGGDGSDTLVGGLGADTLDGSANSSIYDLDYASYEFADTGVAVSLLNSTLNTGEAAGDIFISIEGLVGSSHHDWLQGDNGGNKIFGGAGNDTIEGGLGADSLYGGEGIDTLSFASATGGVSADLYNNSGSAEDNTTDRYEEFENILGSQFRDTLSGDNGANLIDGSGGNDILIGRAGNDTLIGGTGADDMQGMEDNDTYYVDNVGDYVRERWGAGFDTVITSISYSLTSEEVEGLQAVDGTAAINLTANEYANVIVGNDGDNVIDGKKGADVMTGKGGNDTYYVDDPGDVVIEVAGGGFDHVLTSVSHTLSNDVENLTGIGTAAITLTGNSGNNVIVGNSGNNIIIGGGGADTMMGGGGNDIYYVDDVNDRIIDTSGINTVYTYVNFNPGSLAGFNIISLGSNAIDLIGDKVANTLKGNDGANKIYGKAGNDILTGGRGKDTFVFDTALNKTKNVDTITDFTAKDDSIWLDNKYFTKIGKGTLAKPGKLKKDFFKIADKAQDANDFIIYDKAKGILYYDKDGNGSAAAVQFAKVKKGAKLDYKDFFVI